MRYILLLLSYIYNVITSFRNLLFDYKILSSKSYSIPIICIGNLELGGTGKTPHVQYIINLLKSKYKIAVLSRGYGRKSSTIKYVEINDNVDLVGDEPLQIKKNNPSCLVVVEKNRNKGIKNILENHREIEVIILDDGFQHRWVNAGLNIILTDFSNPYYTNHLFPYGTLRENKKNSKRADLIIFTRTPEDTTHIQKKETIEKINLNSNQKFFFSEVKYGDWKCLNKNITFQERNNYNITLVTGIANSTHLTNHLMCTNKVHHVNFPDHHNYSLKDLNKILFKFNNNNADKKIIVTTEKDAVKLSTYKNELNNVNVYYICIDIKFNKKQKFDKEILDYVRKNKRICKISK